MSNDTGRTLVQPPFRTQIASDVDRDGLGVELVDSSGSVVAEVFRSDRERTLTVSTFGNDVPVAEIRDLISFAFEKLGPFEDGPRSNRLPNRNL